MATAWHRGGFCAGALVALLGVGCGPLSERIQDSSVGMNGGFEHTQSGLPVNWYVYSPDTITTGSYELSFDDVDFKEGTQSLKFLVQECSSRGGRCSPGIFQEFPATAGTTYAISFWIKNEGCELAVLTGGVGGVDGKTADTEPIDTSMVTASTWHRVAHEYTVPQQYARIRFELSIRSPGSLWIDDVRIEEVD